jgi:hypothetical protein
MKRILIVPLLLATACAFARQAEQIARVERGLRAPVAPAGESAPTAARACQVAEPAPHRAQGNRAPARGVLHMHHVSAFLQIGGGLPESSP